MWSASFVPHMNHVSVSRTNGNGPTQGQRKTLTRVRIEPTTFGLDQRCSTDWTTRSDWCRPWELKMWISMSRCGFNSHPGQSFSLSLCGPISIRRANAHMVHMGYKTSTSHYTLISFDWLTNWLLDTDWVASWLTEWLILLLLLLYWHVVFPHLILPVKTLIIFESHTEVCKQTTFTNVKRDNRYCENTAVVVPNSNLPD